MLKFTHKRYLSLMENEFRLRYDGEWVNEIQENNRYLLRKIRETYKYTM
jgi:hypothetical protein